MHYFVVHARVETTGLSGTLENLATGVRAQFRSGEELLDLVSRRAPRTGASHAA
ncbi:MAG: hypothetical protein IT352_03800 [Gemmatimonadales bacterium]|nr:hypothetical protein [Gemmatimonadales bacterium]